MTIQRAGNPEISIVLERTIVDININMKKAGIMLKMCLFSQMNTLGHFALQYITF